MLFVGSEWKPSPTPGIVAARLANCRPLSGRFSIRAMSTTPPTDDERVSMSGVPPVTVMPSGYSRDDHRQPDIECLADIDGDVVPRRPSRSPEVPP